MLTAILLTIAGLVILFVGGEVLVRGAVALARNFGVSALFVGIVVVGFGTSAPELVASIEAVRLGVPGIAWGNIIGSNIANTLLILGATALVYPIPVERKTLKQDGGIMMAATVFFAGLVTFFTLGAVMGVILVMALLAYIWHAYHDSKVLGITDDAVEEITDPLWRSALLTVVGIAALMLGGNLLVTGASELAAGFGLSETVIGLTVVAIGTSSPELAASVMAAIRRAPGVALGNVIGSNLYNLLGIGGVTAILAPGSFPDIMIGMDLALLIGSAVLAALIALVQKSIPRTEGAVLFAAYIGYVAYILIR
ncbi:MAG: calcium/sodium antiporter [Pacificimonas sp.]|jgi:cation:H+ antiporter|nr:calcium/sodium antiporter [Pacificimonas sp.]